MIDIVRELHEIVPDAGPDDGEVFDRVSVVGAQKTMERGVEAQFSVQNAYTKTRRLEGLFFQLADWHHENKFLSVSFSLYNGQYSVHIAMYFDYLHFQVAVVKQNKQHFEQLALVNLILLLTE